jgi:single-strand DNA-binding protein
MIRPEVERSIGNRTKRGGLQTAPVGFEMTISSRAGSRPESNRVRLMGTVDRAPKLQRIEGITVLTFLVRARQCIGHPRGDEFRLESHPVVVFGRQAEVYGKLLRVGRRIWIEGRLRTRKWTRDEISDDRATEIVAYEISLRREKAA